MQGFCVSGMLLLLVACAGGNGKKYINYISYEQSLYYEASLMIEVSREDEYREFSSNEILQYVPLYDDIPPDEIRNHYDDEVPPENYVPSRSLEPQMSLLGIQVVEDFLMQFPTMFHYSPSNPFRFMTLEERVNTRLYFAMPSQLGIETYDGQFRIWDSNLRQIVYSDERLFHIGWQFGELRVDANGRTIVEREPIITNEIPNIFIRNRLTQDGMNDYGFFYDNNLNRIESANWILNGSQYATHFTLWNFDNSGIPAVEIHYYGNSFAGMTTRSLFRFDGYKFRRISYDWIHVSRPFYNMRIIDYPFFDPDGNLIFFRPYMSEVMDCCLGYFGYYQVTLLDDFVVFQQIVALDFNRSEWNATWTNYITGETEIYIENGIYGFNEDILIWDDLDAYWGGYVTREHYLPGTNILLTPVLSLDELVNEIYTTVRQRFMDE